MVDLPYEFKPSKKPNPFVQQPKKIPRKRSYSNHPFSGALTGCSFQVLVFSTPLLNPRNRNHPTKVYGDAFEGMYPSVGACDEFIRLFLYHKVMPEKEIVSLEGYLSRSLSVCENFGPRNGWFRGFVGDYTSQLYRDYNKLLSKEV